MMVNRKKQNKKVGRSIPNHTRLFQEEKDTVDTRYLNFSAKHIASGFVEDVSYRALAVGNGCFVSGFIKKLSYRVSNVSIALLKKLHTITTDTSNFLLHRPYSEDVMVLLKAFEFSFTSYNQVQNYLIPYSAIFDLGSRSYVFYFLILVNYVLVFHCYL